MKKILCVILCALSTAVSATPLSDLNKYLDPISSLKANFSQTVYGANSKIVQTAAGKMEFKKPDLFRWQIELPDPNLVVTDGKTLWNYDELLEQVTVESFDVKNSVSPISFLFGNPEENFKIEVLTLERFKLTPLEENQNFRHLELQFLENELRQLRLYDHLDQVAVFDFSQVKNNPALSNERFTFIPPAGVDVVGER